MKTETDAPTEIMVLHRLTERQRDAIKLATGQPCTYTVGRAFIRDAVERQIAGISRRADAEVSGDSDTRSNSPLRFGPGGDFTHEPEIEPRLNMFESLMYISLAGGVIAAFALLWWATR
jgi:hypothetical protein